MIRNFKGLGLALFVALAFGAITAPGASAVVEHTFTSDSGNGKTVLTGSLEPGTTGVFKVTSFSVACTTATASGTVSGNSVDHVSVVPAFGGCTAPVLGAVTVDVNGCTITFDSETFENLTHYPAGQLHANASLACGHTGNITITGPGCMIKGSTTHSGGVIVNHNIPGVTYTPIVDHSGGKTAVTVKATVRTMKVTSQGANCTLVGLGANGTHSNGSLEGSAIVTGYEDVGGSEGEHTFTEGALVNLGLTTP